MWAPERHSKNYPVKSHPWQNFPSFLPGESPYLLVLFGKPCLSIHEKLDSFKLPLGQRAYMEECGLQKHTVLKCKQIRTSIKTTYF